MSQLHTRARNTVARVGASAGCLRVRAGQADAVDRATAGGRRAPRVVVEASAGGVALISGHLGADGARVRKAGAKLLLAVAAKTAGFGKHVQHRDNVPT